MTRIVDAKVEEAWNDAVGDLLRQIDEPSGWNAIKEADNRFILRTTDKAFWYDYNGSALGGLTLVAE